MRRLTILLVSLLSAVGGCSTHPWADILDSTHPGKIPAASVQPYGGVCIPQGPIQPPLPTPGVILGPETAPCPAPAPAPVVVPPPTPLPGPAAPGSPAPIAVPPPPGT